MNLPSNQEIADAFGATITEVAARGFRATIELPCGLCQLTSRISPFDDQLDFIFGNTQEFVSFEAERTVEGVGRTPFAIRRGKHFVRHARFDWNGPAPHVEPLFRAALEKLGIELPAPVIAEVCPMNLPADLKPSLFADAGKPFGSTLENHECEVVALNIMKIRARTGDTWAPMTWEQYEAERRADGAERCSDEFRPFQKVNLICSNPAEAAKFSFIWTRAVAKLQKEAA